MKWLGYKRIAFSSVKMDVVEVKRRSKAAHVADLAQNIRENGDELIHAPTVRMPGKVLLCGRDRMAALLILKAKRLWVRPCECTDTEAADLEASENVHRRTDSRADVIARAVRTKEALLTAKGGTTVPPTQRVTAEARKAVAKAAGVSTGAVRKAQQRSNAKSSAVGFSAPEPPGAPAAIAEEPAFSPNLKLLGVPIEEGRATCDLAAPQQAAIDEADKHLRLALGALKRIELSAVGQELRRQVERVGALVRSHRPESICPWCKHVPALVGTCTGCQTMGYVTAEKMLTAPLECFFIDPPLVIMNGQTIPYADALAGKLPKNGAVRFGPGRCEFCGGPNGKAGTSRCSKPGCQSYKQGKKITAQDAHGNDIPLED